VVATPELFRHPGARHRVTVSGSMPDLALSTTRLTGDDVVADLTLEAQGVAVIVTGTVTGRWTGECRRCLEATGGEVTVEMREVFQPEPVEGETYPLGRDELDLGPAIREALALALPLAPLCDEGCAGPDPEAHPVGSGDHVGAEGDPRWSALDALRFDR
jgi:uncharacterized protein